MDENDLKQYFVILEIEPTDSLDKIKQAYNDLVNIWNPDDFSDDLICKKKVEDRLTKINYAYASIYDYYSPRPYLTNPDDKERLVGIDKKLSRKKKYLLAALIILIPCIALSAYFFTGNHSNVRSIGGNSVDDTQSGDDISSMRTESRVALVIGNGNYKNIKTLKNPVNDAKAMVKALENLNFEVISDVNLTKDNMIKLVRTFGDKIKYGGVGLFYYAGHGVQVNGKNYLIPINAVIDSQEVVDTEAVDVDYILERMDAAKNRLNIVILDACRDNPFKGFRSVGGGGLASMNAPEGTFIAYATAPGHTASDGDGQNGLYTQELIRSMNKPGLKIEEMFKEVRALVEEQSGNKQTPWEASSITGDFYFKLGINADGSNNPNSKTLTASKTSNPEEEMWEKIKTSTNVLDFKDFLKTFPNSKFAPIAKVTIRHLESPQQKQGQTETTKTPEIMPSSNGNETAMDAQSIYNRGILAESHSDFDEAERLFKKAAELGFARAQVQLGNIYFNDDPKNIKEAMKWYNKAAQQGDREAIAIINRLQANERQKQMSMQGPQVNNVQHEWNEISRIYSGCMEEAKRIRQNELDRCGNIDWKAKDPSQRQWAMDCQSRARNNFNIDMQNCNDNKLNAVKDAARSGNKGAQNYLNSQNIGW